MDFSRRTPTPSRSSKEKDKSVDHSQEDEDGMEKADESSETDFSGKHPNQSSSTGGSTHADANKTVPPKSTSHKKQKKDSKERIAIGK